jgi:hypothetical protein
MVKIDPPKGMLLCPIANCSYWGMSEGALSRHIRFGHSIDINNLRDKLLEFGYSRKYLNRMNENQLNKEVQKLKNKGTLV